MAAASLSEIAVQFGALAASIKDRQPEASIVSRIETLQGLCEQAVASLAGEPRTLLMHLTTALRTWHDVWPRFGAQPEFRGAVAREANLWSTRLHTMADNSIPV